MDIDGKCVISAEDKVPYLLKIANIILCTEYGKWTLFNL